MRFLKDVIKTLTVRPYYAFRSLYPVWRFYNLQGVRRFKKDPPRLNTTQKTIVESLRNDGLAITHLTEIHPDGEKILKDMIAFAEEQIQNPHLLTAKQYWELMWDAQKFPFDITNPCIRLGLHPDVLAIPNSYLGMWTRLNPIVGHRTKVMKDGQAARQTQKWHRDPDDRRICKMFIYLNDVDEGGGPFTFVRGSQNDGRYGHVAPQQIIYSPLRYEKGRIPEKLVSREISEHEIVRCTGRAGTVVFADTTGIHKGGYSTHTPRTLILCSYRSRVPISKVNRRRNGYIHPKDFERQIAMLSPEAQFAATDPLIEIP